MEILTISISFLILGLLIGSPIFILKMLRKRNVEYLFISYLLSTFLVTSLLIILLAWWGDYSNKILLYWYGYDFDAMNFSERCKNVAEEDLIKVKQLNKRLNGIGWPVKAILVYIYYLPYLLLVYIVSYIFRKSKKNILFRNQTPVK